jgi:small-conductance mechanosensitive channel
MFIGSVCANPLLMNTQKDSKVKEAQTSYLDLVDRTSSLLKEQKKFENSIEDFDTNILSLQEEINQIDSYNIRNDLPINIQLETAYVEQQAFTNNLATLKNKLFILKDRQKKILPREIKEAEEHYKKHLTINLNPEASDYLLRNQERIYLKQLIDTLLIEKNTQNERLHIIMMQQELATRKKAQLEQHINALKKAQSRDLSRAAEEVIKESITTSFKENQQLVLMPLIRENKVLGLQLQKIGEIIEELIEQQKDAEIQEKKLSKKLQTTKEQIALLESNTILGENLLYNIQKNVALPSKESINQSLANIQLKKYKYEQQHSELLQKIELKEYPSELEPFFIARFEILDNLVKNYGIASIEAARLQVKYDELSSISTQINSLLNKHLFWIRNTSPINIAWVKSLKTAYNWLIYNKNWSKDSFMPEQHALWYIWMVFVTLVLVIYDLSKASYYKKLSKPIFQLTAHKTNYFIKMLQVFLVTCTYSALLPSIILFAGLILFFDEELFISAFGASTLTVAFVFFCYRLFHQLTHNYGLLSNHFNINRKFLNSVKSSFFWTIIITTPFISLVTFTEAYDSSFLKNSIGRGAFIISCSCLAFFYTKIYYHHKSYISISPKLQPNFLEKMTSISVILLPVLCITLSANGYQYSAYQIMVQLQISILLFCCFLMTYLFIRYWMIIQRRKITIEIAKKKKQEYLAQQKNLNQDISTQASLRNEILEDKHSETDLDEISKHTLQLFKSLLTLAFILTIVGLWSQTQIEILAFLDEYPLWSSVSIVDGIQQTQSVTLKSALVFSLIILISMLLVKNLPSFLELIILQRFHVSSANKFAIITVTRYSLVIIGVILAFNFLGVAWSELQWLLAALTLGLGFGLQEIFGNFFSGIMLLFEKPIRIGDTVTIRELTGTISKINIRATTIIDWDRKEIIIPNKAFITEQLINWSLSDPITRITIKVSVARDSDTRLVENLLHQAVQECQYALKSPEPEVWFSGFGSHTQDYEIRAFAKQMDYRWPLRHQLHNNIHKNFKENNIIIAYPQLEVAFHTPSPIKAGS